MTPSMSRRGFYYKVGFYFSISKYRIFISDILPILDFPGILDIFPVNIICPNAHHGRYRL
jgi:hypothetical protein